MHVKIRYPDAVIQIREIRKAVEAGDLVGEELEDRIEELDENIAVKTSRKSGIERREKILDIRPSNQADLEERRAAVIAKWCIPAIYTEQILKNRLKSTLTDGYSLEVNILEKMVSITLELKHYKIRKIVQEMLEGIVPLDQLVKLIILGNIYRSYKKFTYKELNKKTYNQLSTEVIDETDTKL